MIDIERSDTKPTDPEPEMTGDHADADTSTADLADSLIRLFVVDTVNSFIIICLPR
jgi:hypothetical protein